MNEESRPMWFGIRTVYLCDTKKQSGRNVFEERVVVFSGKDNAEAFEKAQTEADKYAKALKMISHPLQIAYEQDGEPLIDGYEVWSELLESEDDLETFYRKRYKDFEYHCD